MSDTPRKNGAGAVADIDASLILSRKKPAEGRVRIVLDPAVADELDDAIEERNMADIRQRLNDKDEATRQRLRAAETRLEAAREAARCGSAEFVFRALSRSDYEELLGEHPPTKAQLDRAAAEDRPEPNYDEDVFPQVLVATCSHTPKLTVEQVNELWESPDWNQAECLSLFNTAINTCQGRRLLDLGKG